MKTKYFTLFFFTLLLNWLYMKPVQASSGKALADLVSLLPDLAVGLAKILFAMLSNEVAIIVLAIMFIFLIVGSVLS